jgi:uncharacterized Tic20 family protein
MNTNKLINGFSYVSILFAPILFPLIVWIVGDEKQVTFHAKRALWLHVIPIVLTIIAVILVGATGLLTQDAQQTSWLIIGLFVIVGLIDVVLYIYNLILGIKIWLS